VYATGRGASGLRGFAIRDLVAYGAHDGRIADRAVVEWYAIDNRHRVQQPALVDLFDQGSVCRLDLWLLDVAVLDDDLIVETALDLVADYRRDLLRRPRRASTTREAVAGGRYVEHFDEDAVHLKSCSMRTARRPWGTPGYKRHSPCICLHPLCTRPRLR